MTESSTTPIERVRRPGRRPLAPRVSVFTRPFWDALSDGRLISTHCRQCGRVSFPPKPLCRSCWSEDIDWIDLPPNGTLYSLTRVHVVPRAFLSDALYDIGIVDLPNGVRLMCRLLDAGPDTQVGSAVRMVSAIYDDGPLFAARVESPPSAQPARAESRP